MIYAILPYYPRPLTLEVFKVCLLRQSEPYTLIVVDAKGDGVDFENAIVLRTKKRMYWTASMNLVHRIFKYVQVEENDSVCILNDDLVFFDSFFTEGAKVKRGEVLIPDVWDNSKQIDGGIKVDWSKKSFTISKDRIDCFSPRGIFMNAKDFQGFKPFNRLLPHYLADYEYSLRQVRAGLKPLKMKTELISVSSKKDKVGIFSKLNPVNPIYWTIFLLLAGRNRFLPLNILKAWVDAFRRIYETPN